MLMNSEYEYDNEYELYEDFEQNVRNSVDILRENMDKNYYYVPFHIHDKYYMLKYSGEAGGTTSMHAKRCEVVEVELAEIYIEVTETISKHVLCFRIIKQPEIFLTATFNQYNRDFFKSMEKAGLKCAKVNEWLKRHREEN